MQNQDLTVNRFRQAEMALRNHPGVTDVAIIRHEGRTVALVVPDDEYLNRVLGREKMEIGSIQKWHKIYDLSQPTPTAPSAPIGLNTITWDSSYTRDPVPATEMREWVEATVADILRFHPTKAYEIGCGTGMLLLRIAPRCERYVGVDFSGPTLNALRQQLKEVPLSQLELMQRSADDFDGLERESFDTVILNSVVQYFPNLAYLSRVLEKALEVVKPGGRIFVGDVRSLPLHAAFACSVEMFQAADDLSTPDLRARIERRLLRDPELVISPAYFLALQSRFSKISRVEISPRGGHSDNEMTRFRYNAVLHIENKPVASEVAFLDWEKGRFAIEEIQSILETCRESIGIKAIGNARIAKDLAAREALADRQQSQTVSDLKNEVEQAGIYGIHPQALIDMGGSLGFDVQLSWASCRNDGSYDAVFVPNEGNGGQRSFVPLWPTPKHSAFVRLANAPGQSAIRIGFIDTIRAYYREAVAIDPPDEFLLVDMLPKTDEGRIAYVDPA